MDKYFKALIYTLLTIIAMAILIVSIFYIATEPIASFIILSILLCILIYLFWVFVLSEPIK